MTTPNKGRRELPLVQLLPNMMTVAALCAGVTAIRMAITGQIRKVFAEDPKVFDPRTYLKPAMTAMQALCEERYQQFGTAGNASKIKSIPLSEMAKRYADGSLDPKFG